MDEISTIDERAPDGPETEPGSTFILGDEGWEAGDYLDPEDDWSLQPDGSYLSPDGAIRTWLAGGPEPA